MTMLLMLSMALGGAESFVVGNVETVAEKCMFTEGPLWLPTGELLFSDIPADTIFRGDKSVFRSPSGQSNGLTLDCAGRLIAAEHKNRRVSRTEKDGAVTVVAARFEGKRLNSPNDVVVRSDGALFFTDPPYGLKGGLEGPEAELDFSGVYCVTPAGALRVLVKDFQRPNGLAFSPDEKRLYVADTTGQCIRAFDAAKDGALSNGRELCEIPSPDGMKVDVRGNLWCTAKDGVRVISPEGKLLETIVFPAQPANCSFGDADAKTLYVTARRSVYKIRTAVAGIPPGSARK